MMVDLFLSRKIIIMLMKTKKKNNIKNDGKMDKIGKIKIKRIKKKNKNNKNNNKMMVTMIS